MWSTLEAWKPALALLYPKYYFFTAFCQWINVIALASLRQDISHRCPILWLHPLSYQLKYSHMKCSRETILQGLGRLQNLGPGQAAMLDCMTCLKECGCDWKHFYGFQTLQHVLSILYRRSCWCSLYVRIQQSSSVLSLITLSPVQWLRQLVRVHASSFLNPSMWNYYIFLMTTHLSTLWNFISLWFIALETLVAAIIVCTIACLQHIHHYQPATLPALGYLLTISNWAF